MTKTNKTYRDLEIDNLLRKSRHIIVEAEPVLANALGREHKIALSFLGAIQDHLFAGSDNGVVDIEGTAGLDLQSQN